MPPWLSLAVVQDALLVLLVTAGGLVDVHAGKIPNALTYPACALGLVLALAAGGGAGLLNSLLGLAVGFVPFFLLFLRGGMGGGDVKLVAAIGAIKGFPFIVNAMMASILVGGFIALAIVTWEGRLVQALKYVGTTLGRVVAPRLEPTPLDTGRAIPFGAAICLGTFLSLVGAWLVAARAA